MEYPLSFMYTSGCGECCTANAQHQAALDVCARQSRTGRRTGQGCQMKYSVLIKIQMICIITDSAREKGVGGKDYMPLLYD